MKTLSLAATVVLLMGCALAQPAPSGNNNNNNEDTKIRGCLSAEGSNYLLTDEPGNIYRLQSDGAKLHDLVGSEIWIRGTATDNSSSEVKQINVKKVMKLFDVCSLPGDGR